MSDIPRINRGGASGLPARPGFSVPWWAIVAGLIVIAILVLNPFKTIDAGTVGVKLRFGQAVGTMDPGIHVVLPFIERAVVYSTRTVKRSFDKVNSYSKDIQASDSRVSVNYRVDSGKAVEVYSRYGETFAETIIDPVLLKRLKEIFGKYDAAEIVTQRERLGVEVENNVRQNMPPGIIIDGVQIENIDFSEAYEQAIEAAMQAQAEVKKTEQELLRQKVEAEKVVVNADAAAKARVAQANAEAEAIRVKGEAEAGAIKAKAEALANNPNLVQLTATEKWNGTLPTTMVPGTAVPFISMPQGNNR
jgi:regulator of protease activity HflC (stomatin/prohibitin superfamily)